MSDHCVRKGIIVHGEDSESDDEMSPSELMYTENCAVHSQVIIAPSQDSSTPLRATSSALPIPPSNQKSSSLLHQKLGDSKKKLQSKIISTYLLPLQQHQKTVQNLRAIQYQNSLKHSNQSLVQVTADLEKLDQLMSSLPSNLLQCLK